MKRLLLVVASGFLVLALMTGLGLWMFLSWWVPIQGKARLIEELERLGPVRVSIGAMRYDIVRGFVLTDVALTERSSRQTWLAAPQLDMQLGWSRLVFQRVLAWHASGAIESPFATRLAGRGVYRLGNTSLALDIRTEEIPLRSVTAPLRAHLPPALTDGMLRLRLHITHAPQEPPVITGEVIGTDLAWIAPAWRLHGDLSVEGEARAPATPGTRWSFQGRAALRDATLTGSPLVGSIEQLRGTARLTTDRVEIETLTGAMLGSPWRVEGTIALQPEPSLDVLVTSRAALAPIAQAFPALGQTWQPDGTVELRAVCRGPLGSPSRLDCLARSRLRDAKLSGPKLLHPLTDINGTLDYDSLTRRLALRALTGRLAQEPFTLDGELTVAPPYDLTLQVTGTAPLEAAGPWLPAERLVSELRGTAQLELAITRRDAALQSTGRVELRDAAARLSQPAVAVDQLSGVVRVSPDELEVVRARFRLNDQPLSMTAIIAPPPFSAATVHRLSAAADFPEGRLELAGRLDPEALLVEDSRLALTHSRLRLTGRISRQPERQSAFQLDGSVELADLSRLPFLKLSWPEAWRAQGGVTVHGEFRGALSDWPGAAINGRIVADHLSLRDVPVEQAVCVIEQDRRVVRLRVPSARVAGGTFAGELAMEPNGAAHKYLLQADLIGLQLAALAEANPAWRARGVTGTASGHGTVSGTWQSRATWRGDGLVTASGERLGELPLLEKIFRGLFGVLADRLGLDALRRAQITQASVQWRLADERFSTEDLRLGGVAGTEPVAVYAKGSVGLDRTLDFIIEPELSEGVVLQSPTTSMLAGTILKAASQLERFRRLIGRHRLTGTLEEPEYRFEFSTQELFKQFSPGAGEFLQNLLDVVR